MRFDPAHIIRLYYHAQAGALTPDEAQEWERFMSMYPEQVTHLATLETPGTLTPLFTERAPATEEALSARLFEDIWQRIRDERTTMARPTHRVHFLKTAWFRVAVILVLLLTGLAVYYSLTKKPQDHIFVQETNIPPPVLPGTDKAILTLSDGREIPLNNNSKQIIADGQLSINNHNGQLIYSKNNTTATNTMTTPKGGQYQLTLADGSRVWLNAASSITYPTAFTGNTREVLITGEAYFEITGNAAKPFIVHTAREQVTVLGTSFNVNAYPDESFIKTSLINGSIKVGVERQFILQPGQAYVNGKVVPTNTEQDIAWKKGVFNFNGISLKQAMRQLARWYNIEVHYENGVEDVEMVGEMDRNTSLQGLLNGLDGMVGSFTVKGNVLNVAPLK